MYRDCRFLSITLRQCVLSKVWHLYCQVQAGTCHPPPQELNHVLLQLLLFNTSPKESGVESRVHTSPLCLSDKSSDKYFHNPILWAQFLYFSIARKTLKSVTVRWLFLWLAKLHKNSRNLLEKIYAWLYTFHLHQNHLCTDLPLASLEQLFRAIWNAVSQAAVLILPQRKLNL